MDMEEVFESEVDALNIIKNGDGETYLPEWNYNGIGDLQVDEAYLIKINYPISFEVCGAQLQPELVPISLEAGWSLVPYLRTTPANAITVLEGINVNGNLVIVKDYAGEAYLPQMGIQRYWEHAGWTRLSIKSKRTRSFTISPKRAVGLIKSN